MSDIRENPLTGQKTVLAPRRAERPYYFRDASVVPPCPFCPGHEDMSEESVDTIMKDGRWQVRSVPNKYPVLSGEEAALHEVIIETPDHALSLHQMTTEDASLVIEMYRRRLDALLSLPETRYVQIFKNHGRMGGASIPHAHTQVIALPYVPPLVEKMASRMEKSACVLCNSLNNASLLKERLIYETDRFIAFFAYAPRYAYEVWMMPKAHQASISLLSEEEASAFGAFYLEVFARLSSVLGYDFPHNFWFYNAPKGSSSFHWYGVLCPRLSQYAGFELSTGTAISVTTPEEAAKNVRKNYAI